MPNWRSLLDEISAAPIQMPHDVVRHKYLTALSHYTGRNTIVYYSGWLHVDDGESSIDLELNDTDKNGFMATIHSMDRSLGLDLLLHTPGGDVAATESLVEYLRLMFVSNIRAIIPQIAMSAGTMVACACGKIVMGKQSSLGPIDPSVAGYPANGFIEEFDRAKREISADPQLANAWLPILQRYPPTLLGRCARAIEWSNEIVTKWLETGMFAGDPSAAAKAAEVVVRLSDHNQTRAHARHLGIETLRGFGLDVTALEDDQDLQDAVLSVHHVCMQTLSDLPILKLIENQKGVKWTQGL